MRKDPEMGVHGTKGRSIDLGGFGVQECRERKNGGTRTARCPKGEGRSYGCLVGSDEGD